MEHMSLRQSSVMIINNLTRSPMNNPDAMIGEFCVAAGKLVNLQQVPSQLPPDRFPPLLGAPLPGAPSDRYTL